MKFTKDIKSTVALIGATTALITAITEFMKELRLSKETFDKSVAKKKAKEKGEDSDIKFND